MAQQNFLGWPDTGGSAQMSEEALPLLLEGPPQARSLCQLSWKCFASEQASAGATWICRAAPQHWQGGGDVSLSSFWQHCLAAKVCSFASPSAAPLLGGGADSPISRLLFLLLSHLPLFPESIWPFG